MTLGEKILYMRKKAGLSQEELAEVVGVSRQAVSKWETGEATPEVGKLLLLTRAFGVTADWLISDGGPDAPGSPQEHRADPKPEPHGEMPPPEIPAADYIPEPEPMPDLPPWARRLGGPLGRAVRRYGWLAGVKTALLGSLLAALGWVIRLVGDALQTSEVVLPPAPVDSVTYISGAYAVEGVYTVVGDTVVTDIPSTGEKIVQMLAGFFTGAGITLTLAGVIIAVALRRYQERRL